MSRIEKPERLTITRSFRLTPNESKLLDILAEMYAHGQVSTLIRHMIKNFNPRMLKPARKKKAHKD